MRARAAGAPAGVKGLSLFVVPKFLVNDDGSLGERNDVHCVRIGHALGIKASPTAALRDAVLDGSAVVARFPAEALRASESTLAGVMAVPPQPKGDIPR